VILLDFGAAREFPDSVAQSYSQLLRAGVAGDEPAIAAAARKVGLMDSRTEAHHETVLMAMFDMAMEPLRSPGPFDFGATDLAHRLREAGMALGASGDFWTLPPMDTLYLQRKVAGMYLLATRLGARVDIRRLIDPYL
jgi:hypothetical protein